MAEATNKATLDDVRHVANLAHLDLGADEQQRMLKDLNAILGHIEHLNEVNTEGVEAMAAGLPDLAQGTAGFSTPSADADSGRNDRFLGDSKDADSGRNDRCLGDSKRSGSGRNDRCLGDSKRSGSGRNDRFLGDSKDADFGRNDIDRDSRESLREDVVRPSLDRAPVMAEAPETDGVFFKVPKVIER